MATKQGTTRNDPGPQEAYTGEATLGAVGGLSRANYTRIAGAFPTDPKQVVDALNDTGAKDPANPIYAHYISVARGTITGNSDFGDVDLTFNTADNKLGDKGPNALDDAVGGNAGGEPANAFVPNTASPGQGNGVNPAAMPAPPNTGMTAGSTPGEGVGSQLGVAESSAAQAGAADTLGVYGLGSSPYSAS